MGPDRPPEGLSFNDMVKWYETKKERENEAFDRRLAAGEIRYDHDLDQIVETNPSRTAGRPTPAVAADAADALPRNSNSIASNLATASSKPACPDIQMIGEVSTSKDLSKTSPGPPTALMYHSADKDESHDDSRGSSVAMEMSSERDSTPDVPLASLPRSRQSSAQSLPSLRVTPRAQSASVESAKPMNLPQRNPGDKQVDIESSTSASMAQKRPGISQLASEKLPKIPRMASSDSSSSAGAGGSSGPFSRRRVPKFVQNGTFGNALPPVATVQTPAQTFSEHVDRQAVPWNTNPSEKERSKISDRGVATLLKNVKDEIRTAERNRAVTQAHEATLDTIREYLHKFEHQEGIDQLIMRDSRLLTEESGLPRLFLARHDGFRFPFDIILDAKALYHKWSIQDFDPDIMRGILSKRNRLPSGGKSKSNAIRKDYTHRKSSTYWGPGDLVSGQWWPLLIAALRDGAHGDTQAGISGVKGQGATSVIMTGAHKYRGEDGAGINECDKDEGDTVRYRGSDPKEGKDCMSDDTALLYDNVRLRKPVRLLRSHQLNNLYSPAKGFRYDGVYDVVNGSHLPSKSHHHIFELRRQPNQDPIRYQGIGKRPTPEDLEAYQRHKDLSG